MEGSIAHRALILDLDDTLHSSEGLARAYVETAARLVARRLALTLEEAREKLRVERDRLSAEAGGGGRVTLSRTLGTLGIGLDDWVAARDSEVDPSPLVRADARLRRQLERLAGYYTLAILTNNSRAQTEAITRAIGIRDLFEDRIFPIDVTLTLKPDPAVFQRVADAIGVAPERCISIGDRLAIDIEPARQIGMRGMVVDPPNGIHAVLDVLLAETA